MSEHPLSGMVRLLQHVSVPSTDLSRSRRFYCEKVGLSEQSRPPFSVNGIWLDAGEGTSIHLTEAPTSQTHPLSHFALKVDELGAALTHLAQFGIPYKVGEAVPGAGLQAYLSDPDGNIIELIEINIS